MDTAIPGEAPTGHDTEPSVPVNGPPPDRTQVGKPQPLGSEADQIISTIYKKAKVNPKAKLSKQAPVRLTSDEIIDLYHRAKTLAPEEKEKLIAFLKSGAIIQDDTFTEGKIRKSQLEALVEHIVKGVVKEVDNAKKRWTVKLEKEQTCTAAAAPVTGPNAFKKKTLESVTTPDLTDDRMQGQFVDRGQIKLEGGLDYDTAEKIASYHWDIFGSYGKDERGVWNFKIRGERWCCSVGMLNGQPAILSVTTTPGRLNLLVGNETMPKLTEMTTTSGGGGSSAGTPGYQIPGAWAGGSIEKNKKHIEVLGYTLTPAGKKEMKRAGDNLYEHVQVEASGLGADFDRAQSQYDQQMPPENESGDGIECPECGSLHGYVTDKGHKGSAYWIQMKCGQCGAEWGHDNFDALDDR